ncbi:hypothetical protein [Legionella erythra]|uniref:Uncharacterized protein n=1 Tax=Legionella erythra TaxID=448 RepID=A0A0W0TVU3_LEGER|nr:hypothetical protein [Legionella erythra]KTC99632.1 hypothetical protein Lery_0533 [Legionella erythra]
MSKQQRKKGRLNKDHLKDVSGGQQEHRRKPPPVVTRPEPPPRPHLPPLTQADK